LATKIISMSNWTIFSNHGHVLFCLARNSDYRLRDVATDVGLTERAVQKIVRDLQDHGMIIVSKHGRRNRYRIDKTKTLRHSLEAHCTLGVLVNLIANESSVDTVQTVQTPAQSKPVVTSTPAVKPAESKPVQPGESKHLKPDSKRPMERQQGSLF